MTPVRAWARARGCVWGGGAKDKVVVYTTALDLDKQIYDGVDTLTISYERNTPDIKTT